MVEPHKQPARGQQPRAVDVPTGGLRIAYSYLISVMAALLGGGAAWGIAAWLYSSGLICAGREGFGCPVLSFSVLALTALVVLSALGAWWSRLRRLWLLWSVALLLVVVEVAGGDPGSWWALLALVVPLLAAVVTDPTARGMSPRRRWVTLGLGALVVAQFALVVWSATW